MFYQCDNLALKLALVKIFQEDGSIMSKVGPIFSSFSNCIEGINNEIIDIKVSILEWKYEGFFIMNMIVTSQINDSFTNSLIYLNLLVDI